MVVLSSEFDYPSPTYSLAEDMVDQKIVEETLKFGHKHSGGDVRTIRRGLTGKKMYGNLGQRRVTGKGYKQFGFPYRWTMLITSWNNCWRWLGPPTKPEGKITGRPTYFG